MTGLNRYWFDIVKTYLEGTRPLPRCPLREQSIASTCFKALMNQAIEYEEKYRPRALIFLTGYHENFNRCKETEQ